MEHYMKHIIDTDNNIDGYFAESEVFSKGDLLLRKLGFTEKLIVLRQDQVIRERFLDKAKSEEICFDLINKTVECLCSEPLTNTLLDAIDLKRKEYEWID